MRGSGAASQGGISSHFQVAVASEGIYVDPQCLWFGDRQAVLGPVPSTARPETRNWPLGLGKDQHILSGLYQFPASLGTIREEGASLPGQEGGERAHPSGESSPGLVGTDTGNLSGQAPCRHLPGVFSRTWW